MRLIITTLGRVSDQKTLKYLPDQLAEKTEIWVQSHEYDLYSTYYTDVHRLPEWVTRLGQTRQYLVYHYWGEKIVLLDDDLDFYWRPNPADWHLKTPGPDQMLQMFDEVEMALDHYAHVGISGREGQNHEPAYAAVCSRYMRVLCYNTGIWPDGIRCDRLDGMSDFDTALQLLRRGYPSLVFYRHAQGQKYTQFPGGCAMYRTQETHSAEVETMCRIHRGLVTPVRKYNRTGGAFGQRDEVLVEWKRALGWDHKTGSMFSESADCEECLPCLPGGDGDAEQGEEQLPRAEQERRGDRLPGASDDTLSATM